MVSSFCSKIKAVVLCGRVGLKIVPVNKSHVFDLDVGRPGGRGE